jgi:hypothetical protein
MDSAIGIEPQTHISPINGHSGDTRRSGAFIATEEFMQ